MLKNDTSGFAKKTDLPNLKSDKLQINLIYKLYIDKLKKGTK